MMEWVAAGAGGAAVLAGLGLSARFNWWRPKLKGIPVLMYHHITDILGGTPLPKLRVTPKAFAAQLDFLQDHGYKTITLGRAMAPNPPPNGVVLSFDDGYYNFYTEAWPLLKRRGMTATVFLVTGALDGDNYWDLPKGEPLEKVMTRAQVRELDAAGIEFGGHSHHHQDLTKLDERGLRREITGCQKVLSDLLGRSCRVFSYPYGLHNEQAQEAVARAGFTAACVTQPGKVNGKTNPMTVPRIIVKRSDNLLDLRLKLSRGKSRL